MRVTLKIHRIIFCLIHVRVIQMIMIIITNVKRSRQSFSTQLVLSVVTKGFTKYLRERIINLDKIHLANVAHTFILPLEPLRWNWKKVPASSKGSSFLTLVSAIVASFPHSLHVSKSHAKQLKRLVPLLRTNSPLDQHFSSLHLKKVGPISEGQMRNSSPHWLHGRLVLGISLKTSRI